MPAPRQYPEELKERATWLALNARADPSTHHGALARIAGQLDINADPLHGWVRLAEAGGHRPRTGGGEGAAGPEPVSDRERVAALEKEVRKLRRRNTTLRQSSTGPSHRLRSRIRVHTQRFRGNAVLWLLNEP